MISDFLAPLFDPKPVHCPKRQGPSPANLRAARRILEHRRRNWPDTVAVPQSQAHSLPKFRKGGGQREVGA